MSSSVEDWLRSLGFIHYTQAFLDNGYDELEICKEIGKEDLDAIGVRNFKDRTDILNAVERLKQSGTAVYFVLEGGTDSEPLQAQPERDTYLPVSLKMMLHDKLEEDKIDLTTHPYSKQDGSEGCLDTLVTLYADKFYTYEEHVLRALRILRQNKVEKEGAYDSSSSQFSAPPHSHERHSSTRHSSKSRYSDDHNEEPTSEDDVHHRSVSSEDPSSPAGRGWIPADYLDVDSPAQRGKKEKKRRKVERNTKLSRSLDSLKELHVNVEPKPRDREASSLKSKPFRFRLFHGGSKKKNHGNEIKKQPLEKKLSNQKKEDYNVLASAIKMGEEDRMALMIMVKQGELTVEEAVEQLKRYEEDSRNDDYLKPKNDFSCEDEKMGNKPKLKRGIFGKSTKRKSSSRPSSEFIASEMTTMSEEDRINLMRSVKNGEMSVEQALKRFVSYEEKHKRCDSDDASSSRPARESPRLPKSSGFSRISIKRVSGALSSASFRLSGNPALEPNSVFYTGVEGANAGGDGGSVDSSMSSGDEVLGTNDSSPAPSPKRLLANVQGVNKSPHSSSSSVESMGRADEKPVTCASPHRQPNFLSEMKAVLGKQAQSVDNIATEGVDVKLQQEQKSRQPLPGRQASLPVKETQRITPLSNPTDSLKMEPDVPARPGSTVSVPHRAPPPVPTRPSSKNFEDRRKSGDAQTDETPLSNDLGKEIKSNDPLLETKTLESAKLKNNQNRKPVLGKTKGDELSEGQGYLKPVSVEQKGDGIIGEGVKKPRHRPPPLPPRPKNSTTAREDTVARSVETQTSPPPANASQRHKDSKLAASTEEVYKVPVVHNASEKPQLKPKPKPKPRPRAKMTETQDTEDELYTAVPPPRPVEGATSEVMRTHGESSSSSMETNMDRAESKPSITKRTELGVSKNEAGDDSSPPVPAPRVKRPSHSLGEMIERKLHIERIDLTQKPYTDANGCWGVPVNLVDRYAEELRRSHEELANILERLRIRKLKKAGRTAVPCNVSELEFTRDPLGSLESMEEWLISLGLPMYITSLAEVEYDDMAAMPGMEERHFQFAGISDPRHMSRLLTSVAEMSS
ncbi:SAM and SH3 domain-containing protein 1-like [Stylophora pistillata]|uniref:SAM and SH3 domain-containing protein 1 n=1 Tax=Stylophora pistillata TaxID=50429 RepID=A0A2B4T1Q4_STYPI|nr:SAM and SH3 domain-containing protein 1-like [Stylophora pistillata]PFX34555.1 SAM and SH3 domain-containing protein 1 [Stylophora pistillata]